MALLWMGILFMGLTIRMESCGVVMMLIHAMDSDMEMVVTHMQALHFGHIWLGVGDQVFHQENTFPVVDPVLVVTPLFINRLVLSYWLGLDC